MLCHIVDLITSISAQKNKKKQMDGCWVKTTQLMNELY